MHDDLLRISDLLKVETEMDALRSEAAELAGKVERSKKRIADLEQQRLVEEGALRGVVEKERGLSRRVADFGAKRERTQGLINTGQGNYAAATAQLAEIEKVLGELDSEMLAVLEEREKAEALVARTVELQKVAAGRLKTAAEKQRSRRPEIEARYKVLTPERLKRTEDLGHHLAARYKDLRARKRPVLVRVVDGNCEFCHMAVPAHIVTEVFGGRRAHACRGCGCWFRDAVDTSATPVTEEDED